MSTYHLILIRYFLLLMALTSCLGGSYSEKKQIHDTLLSSANYSPDIRPLLDQADILSVSVAFVLVSIKEINDVIQSFECNGFLQLSWDDQLLTWNPSDYGGETDITPKPVDVWRPRMVLLNTMKDRDLFEDDPAPMSVRFNGLTTWTPGAIFPASCNMDLTNYPYDTQTCEIQMLIMNYDPSEIQLVSLSQEVSLVFYTANGEWEILSTKIESPNMSVDRSNISSILVTFNLKRRPQFLIISILLPIAFLSLLNLLVFLIPVESGEKISYGITVLLALSVFMSIMSAMLPSSSESMPLIIYYIFILLVISVLTVVDSIVIVKLHHLEEETEKTQRVQSKYQSAQAKVSSLQRSVSAWSQRKKIQDGEKDGKTDLNESVGETHVTLKKRPISPEISPTSNDNDADVEDVKVNRYKIIGKYIDQVSLLVFALIWVGVTFGFFLAIAV